jgi:hypothetical protein
MLIPVSHAVDALAAVQRGADLLIRLHKALKFNI